MNKSCIFQYLEILRSESPQEIYWIQSCLEFLRYYHQMMMNLVMNLLIHQTFLYNIKNYIKIFSSVCTSSTVARGQIFSADDARWTDNFQILLAGAHPRLQKRIRGNSTKNVTRSTAARGQFFSADDRQFTDFTAGAHPRLQKLIRGNSTKSAAQQQSECTHRASAVRVL